MPYAQFNYSPEALRRDAAEADAAYRRSVDRMNDWRLDRDAHEPAAEAPRASGSAARADAAEAEAAYRRSADRLNAWRDQK